MAYVIAVLNQKGGAGKTTLATNLSTVYTRRGNRTLLADADPQGTARNWRANGPDRDESEKTFPSVVGTEKAEDVREVTGEDVAEAFDVVVIDGPPGMSSDGPGAVTVEALKAADIVLIPVRPSGADLWATSPISELVRARRDATGEGETLAAAFVVTQADARTNVADEITGSLQSLALPVLDARSGYRVAYARALGKGLSVLDVRGRDKAAAEIEAIADEINTRFHA
jgi:chromosome partitioning protein